jgi:hypothetical protein
MPHVIGVWKAVQELREDNSRSIESIIRFLERDEYRFRSGYLKEYCWHHLKRAQLTESQKHRLRQVALAYLHKRIQREFWYMCRFIWRIADDIFRGQVEHLARSPQPEVSKRASLLKPYLDSPATGERARKKFYYECLHAKYGGRSL